MNNRQRTALVVGGTGNIGRHVVSQLESMGVQVRVITRDPIRAAFGSGVDVRDGDLTKPESLDASVEDVDGVFLVWPLGATTIASSIIKKVTSCASRIVYVSSMGIDDSKAKQSNPIDQSHFEIEHLIREAGIDWTVLRCSGFALNTLGWAQQIRGTGVVRWPFAGARRSLIDERDIAAVAVQALTTENEASGGVEVLTGPRTVSQEEQVHILGDILGRKIRFEEIAPAQARKELFSQWPVEVVTGMLSAWGKFVEEPELVTDRVKRLLNVDARDYREWATYHSKEFR